MRALTIRPELHSLPGFFGSSRSIARSTHSPCGDTWSSLYRVMRSDSQPMNASATSQFHSRGVSSLVVGSGFRFSSS